MAMTSVERKAESWAVKTAATRGARLVGRRVEQLAAAMVVQ